MKVLARFTHRHFESNETHGRAAATSPNLPASLLTITILIASVSSTVAAASGAAHHHGRLFVVADGAAGADSRRPAHEAQKANGSDSSVIAVADRAMNDSYEIAQGLLQPVWDAALWIAQQALTVLSFSGLDPEAAEHGVTPSVDSNRAASVIAFALMGFLLFATAGPLYYSWKLRRMRYVRRRR